MSSIGVFDSGFGGLSILKALRQVLPQYDYVYLGDSRRNPYGNRSDETILDWTRECVDFLMREKGCHLIIVACHTASNVALRSLQRDYLPNSPWPERRILGVTIPLIEAACKIARYRVGILATKATCRSGGFVVEMHKRRPELQVFQQAAPLLVGMVEEGLQKSPECNRLMRRYLNPLKRQAIDTLILGCTHFPLLYRDFCAKAGNSIKVLDSGKVVSLSLLDYLKRHPEIEQSLKQSHTCSYLTTDDPKSFSEQGKMFLGQTFSASKIWVEGSYCAPF